MSREDQLLTERITIRFTESELQEIRSAMVKDGMRKESAFLRRVIVLYLQKKGFHQHMAPPSIDSTSAFILNEDAPLIVGSAKRSGLSKK